MRNNVRPRHRSDSPSQPRGGDNEKTLSNSPCSIGSQLCFADLRPTKRRGDPQTTQKILAGAKAFDEATNNNDAAALAAHYTREAVYVTTEGPIIGRQAIQKWFTDLYQWWHPKNRISKYDGNAVHFIGTAGNELWATGEWSETGQGKNGKPLPIKGYWSAIFVREGDDWKMRVSEFNTTSDSYTLPPEFFTTSGRNAVPGR